MRLFSVILICLTPWAAFTNPLAIGKTKYGRRLTVRTLEKPQDPTVEGSRPIIPEPAPLHEDPKAWVRRLEKIASSKVSYETVPLSPLRSKGLIEGASALRTDRPIDGNSDIVRTPTSIEIIIGYRDMPLSWVTGREGDLNTQEESITSYSTHVDEQRRLDRLDALNQRMTHDTPPEPILTRYSDNTVIARGYPEEGLRYYSMIEDAKVYAKELNLPIVIIRPGKPIDWKDAEAGEVTLNPILGIPKFAKNLGLSFSRHSQFRVIDGLFPHERVGLVEFPDQFGGKLPDKTSSKRQISRLDQLNNPVFPSSINATTDAANQFELFFSALQIIQGNISDTIFPFLKEMVSGSNSSLVYNAAWSIWAELTMANEYVIGPFCNGLHRFDDLEDQYAKDNKLSTNDALYLGFLALNAVLINLYESAWNQSYTAVNASGLLGQRDKLVDNLQTNDTSIQSALFKQVNQPGYDDLFFLTYN